MTAIQARPEPPGRRQCLSETNAVTQEAAGSRRPSRCKSQWKRRHPGARASRPHALPFGAAQFPCDSAPGHPAGGNAMGWAEAGSEAVAGRTARRSWPRLCQDVCGRDARAPGWASFRDVVVAAKAPRQSLRLRRGASTGDDRHLPVEVRPPLRPRQGCDASGLVALLPLPVKVSWHSPWR